MYCIEVLYRNVCDREYARTHARTHTHTHTYICMYVYIYIYIYIYILYWSVCSPVVLSCTIWDEVVIPLPPRKYTVLKGNFVFDLRDVSQEGNPGTQRDLPVYYEHEKNVHVVSWAERICT